MGDMDIPSWLERNLSEANGLRLDESCVTVAERVGNILGDEGWADGRIKPLDNVIRLIDHIHCEHFIGHA